MSEVTIKICDVCGIQHSNTERRHWSDKISTIKLSLKDHPAVQLDLFSGDMCSICAINIQEGFVKILNELRSPDNKEKTNVKP